MSNQARPTNIYRIRLAWKPEGESPSRTHSLQTSASHSILIQPGSEQNGELSGSSPEELFLGAVSSCLMLTFINLCRKNSLVVLSYQDEAKSVLVRGKDGRFSIERIHLRPRVTFREPDLEDWRAFAVRLFHEAHYYCFLINSIKSSVDVEPMFVIEEFVQ